MNLYSRIIRYFKKPVPSIPNPRPDDVYLVSYPKSGNTWLRYLLAYSIWPETRDLDLKEMAAYIPSFALSHDATVVLDPDAPCNRAKHRIIKEHFPYNKAARIYVQNVIYLVRDGRDAMVSYWHFCNQRDGTDIPFLDFIRLSRAKQGHFGRWHDHVVGWLNAPIKNKLIVRYEDLKTDTLVQLKRVLDFLEIDVEKSIMQEAIEKASFESMKRLEKTKGFNLEQLKNVNFVRKGKVGSWQDVFGENEVEEFIRSHGHGVKELGYDW
jgi:hypothetical protein